MSIKINDSCLIWDAILNNKTIQLIFSSRVESFTGRKCLDLPPPKPLGNTNFQDLEPKFAVNKSRIFVAILCAMYVQQLWYVLYVPTFFPKLGQTWHRYRNFSFDRKMKKMCVTDIGVESYLKLPFKISQFDFKTPFSSLNYESLLFECHFKNVCKTAFKITFYKPSNVFYSIQ